MPYNPDVSFFVPFHRLNLDLSPKAQCIFFTLGGNRCQNKCKKSDTAQARALYDVIDSSLDTPVDLDLIEDCILYNCCNQAGHRQKLDGNELLTVLAQRWQNEIRKNLTHTSSISEHTSAVANTVDNTATRNTSIRDSGIDAHHDSRSTSANSTTSRFKTSSSSYQYESTVTPSLFGSQPRHNLRSRNVSDNSNCDQIVSILQPSLSLFCPHKERPRPDDSVFHKIQVPIQRNSQDDLIGSLYIFDRPSSQGYVKIGWSRVSGESRLTAWAKCRYEPRLLFSINKVPHARRVETLAHYELLKEWRRERMCGGCGKSHKEWFEIAPERAKQVVGNWAEFMKIAEPYDSCGYLKTQWYEVIRKIVGKGEVVTAKKLLEHHEATAQHERTVEEIRRLVDELCREFAARTAGSGTNGLELQKTLDLGALPALEASITV